MTPEQLKAMWAKTSKYKKEHHTKKSAWSNYKPFKSTTGNNTSGQQMCQHCNVRVAEKSKLRGNYLCGSCKDNVWKSDTEGSNYDRFIGMGMSDQEARSDSGYRL